MSLQDLDSYYIRVLDALYSSEFPLNKEPLTLQLNLQEVIKAKTGTIKDFGPALSSITKRSIEEIRTISHVIEEPKTTSSSDNELELDLFNEDLMCIICNGMDVGARNRLLECSDCHSLYHQECHCPPVTSVDTNNIWTCQTCKDAALKVNKTPGSSPPRSVPSPPAPIKPVLKIAPPGVQYQINSPLFQLIGTKTLSKTALISKPKLPLARIKSTVKSISSNIQIAGKPSSSNILPSTSKASTSGNLPSTSKASTSGNLPSSSKASTSGNLPSTSKASASGNVPSASKAGTSGNLPSASKASTSGNLPSASKASTSGNVSSTSKASTSGNVASTSKASSSGSSNKSSTPNISIATAADKRLQIMKKKAAKLHEKRRHLPR